MGDPTSESGGRRSGEGKTHDKTHDTGRDAPRLEAILFGLVPHGDPRTAAEALQELQMLADTGEWSVGGCVVQHRRTPDPNSYLGRGKLEELGEIVRQTGAKAVICDDSLSPTQARNIEQVVDCPVLDRSELILQIFALHARTPQAKLQVELASLRYEMPRLKRKWTHLERQRGGIGIRGGAGEKQIDVDRSLLQTRISQISDDLKKIEARKGREIKARPDLFTVALVGYTNAGKSSLMNAITASGVLAENRLFSTLDTRTRPWRMPGGRTVLLSDTVGFIQKLPHQLVASFHATLEEALHADLLFLVVDGSDPVAIEQIHTVEEVLDQLDAGDIPRQMVINKLDLVDDRSELASLFVHAPDAVTVSARSGEGLDDLRHRLEELMAEHERRVEILIPHTAGALRAEIRGRCTVVSELFTENGCLMEISVSPALLGKLLAKGALLSS